MSFRPVQGYFGNLEYLNQQAEQSAQDALLAQQQAAAFAQQQQEETAAYKAQLDDMLAQNQAMYDEALRQQETQGAQMQSGGMTAGAPNFGGGTAEQPQHQFGNKWADMFASTVDNYDYNGRKFSTATVGDPNQKTRGQAATLWNRDILDKWMDDQATRNGWNDIQKATIRKQIVDGLTRSTGNKQLFDAESRGITGLVGDAANRFVDGSLGSLAEIAAVGNIYLNKGVDKTLRDMGFREDGWGGKLGLVSEDNQSSSRAFLQNVQKARDWFGSFRSDESRDAELARSAARGMAEQWDAIKDNPVALTDELANMAGMLLGAKGWGGATKVAGNSIAKGGLAQAVRGGAAAEAGSLTAGTAAKLGLQSEIQTLAGQAIGRSTGLMGIANRTAGNARMALGRGIAAVGERGAATNPLVNVSLIEGADVGAQVLSQPGAWDESKQAYTDDAALTALGASALNAGITYGMGTMFHTVAGSGSRFINGMSQAERGAATKLGQQVLSSQGGVTIDTALKTVADELSAGATPAARDTLNKVVTYLTSEEGKLAALKAVGEKSTMGKLLEHSMTLSGGMLAEGVEEGLIGAVTSAASQAIDAHGNFDPSRIDPNKVWDTAGSAAVLGATLGVFGGSLHLAQDIKNANNTIDSEIKSYREQANKLQADIDATEQQAAQPVSTADPTQQVVVDPLQQAQQAADPNQVQPTIDPAQPTSADVGFTPEMLAIYGDQLDALETAYANSGGVTTDDVLHVLDPLVEQAALRGEDAQVAHAIAGIRQAYANTQPAAAPTAPTADLLGDPAAVGDQTLQNQQALPPMSDAEIEQRWGGYMDSIRQELERSGGVWNENAEKMANVVIGNHIGRRGLHEVQRYINNIRLDAEMAAQQRAQAPLPAEQGGTTELHVPDPAAATDPQAAADEQHIAGLLQDLDAGLSAALQRGSMESPVENLQRRVRHNTDRRSEAEASLRAIEANQANDPLLQIQNQMREQMVQQGAADAQLRADNYLAEQEAERQAILQAERATLQQRVAQDRQAFSNWASRAAARAETQRSNTNEAAALMEIIDSIAKHAVDFTMAIDALEQNRDLPDSVKAGLQMLARFQAAANLATDPSLSDTKRAELTQAAVDLYQLAPRMFRALDAWVEQEMHEAYEDGEITQRDLDLANAEREQRNRIRERVVERNIITNPEPTTVETADPLLEQQAQAQDLLADVAPEHLDTRHVDETLQRTLDDIVVTPMMAQLATRATSVPADTTSLTALLNHYGVRPGNMGIDRATVTEVNKLLRSVGPSARRSMVQTLNSYFLQENDVNSWVSRKVGVRHNTPLLRDANKAEYQALVDYFTRTKRQSPEDAEASARAIQDEIVELTDGKLKLTDASFAAPEVAESEAKKLSLIPPTSLDGSEDAAIQDTARAMNKHGASAYAEPAAQTETNLFAEPEATVDVQEAFDALADEELSRQDGKDLFNDDFDFDSSYDESDLGGIMEAYNDDFASDLFRDRRAPRNEWEQMTQPEQSLAVQQETIARATRVLRDAFGPEILQHVVFVSPNSLSLSDSNVSTFVLDGDPNSIYVVADPTRADHQFVYNVAHELLHQRMDVNVRGKLTQWGDYQQTMDKFMQNIFVQELMGAMRPTYPNLDSYALAEEALAEIHAARTSEQGWNTLRETWGIASKVPAELRSKANVGFMHKIISFFKNMVAQWRGKRGTTDADLAEFLRVVSMANPEAAAELRTPEAAQQFRARMEFEAARQRVAYYAQLARENITAFDVLPRTQQQAAMAEMARNNGDTLSERELGLQIRYARKPQQSAGSANPNGTVNQTPQQAAQAQQTLQQAAQLRQQQAAQAAQVPPSNDPQGQQQFASKLVKQIMIYPQRAVGAAYTDDLDNFVGAITLESNGALAEVRVRMHDPRNGMNGLVHVEPLNGDIDGAMYKAWEWLEGNYPNQYTRPHGSTYDARTGSILTPAQVYIMNRAQQMGLSSPTLRKWTKWLAAKLPAQYLPVLDKFLDFVSVMRTRWVDIYTSMREVENMYSEVTGKPATVLNRLIRDIGEGTSFLHRNFNAGRIDQVAGKKQSFRDRVEAIRDAMQQEGISQERINKVLYGLEEAVRYNIFLNSPASEGHWATDANGKRYIVQARNNKHPAQTVTGFNFQDLNTIDPHVGKLDLGGQRFMAALSGLSVEERNKIGRIVAEVSATGRTIAELQHSRGVLTQTDYHDRMRRGKRELGAAFPELAAQGYDFGGFFMTMRDEDTSAYDSHDSQGRTTAIDNVLGNNARVWEAEVKKAFRNNEMAQFALMVLSLPNKHFAVEPLTPRIDPDDPTGAPLWEGSDKNVKASTTVYVNGVPVQLVAKTKQAAMLFDRKALHPGIAKVGALNHYFNQFKTSLNPAYPLFGFGRDMMTGFLNISGAIGEQYVSSKDAMRVGGNTVGYALKYLLAPNKNNLFYGTWRGQHLDAWAEAYQRLGAGMLFGDDLNTGAFANINNNPLISGHIGRSTDLLAQAKDKVKGTAARVAETIAYPPETAMRLGAFRAYTEHLLGNQLKPNMTAEQIVELFDQFKNPQNNEKAAAIIVGTKNLTSNFQQHGADSVVRNLFSFHNAVMQGSFSTLPQILSTEHGRKVSAMILVASALAAAAAISGEDDDEFGNSKYFQIPRRNRNIVLSENIQIPISDELGWIKNLADNVVGVMMGRRNVMDASTDQLHAMSEMVTSAKWGDTDNAFTNALYAVTPTMGQAFITMATGYDTFGRKVKSDYAYDDNGKRIQNAADVERSTSAASETGIGIAEFLYGATGGGIDMTGDEVDVMGRSFLGGLYGSFARTQTATMRDGDGVLAAAGDEFLRSTRVMHIDRKGAEAWQDLGERLGISLRNQGGTLDVLNAGDGAAVGEAYNIYAKSDKALKKAKSDMGYTYKQLYDMIAKAEAEGRYQDARDLRADMRTIRANQEAIRRDALAEINALGIK